MEGERKLLVLVYTNDPGIHEATTRRLSKISGHFRLNNDYHACQSYIVICLGKKNQGGVVVAVVAKELDQGKET